MPPETTNQMAQEAREEISRILREHLERVPSLTSGEASAQAAVLTEEIAERLCLDRLCRLLESLTCLGPTMSVSESRRLILLIRERALTFVATLNNASACHSNTPPTSKEVTPPW